MKPTKQDFTGKAPTHRLKVKLRDGKDTTTVGSGWQNADGSISLHLSPGVVLDYDLTKTCMITLFPIASE